MRRCVSFLTFEFFFCVACCWSDTTQHTQTTHGHGQLSGAAAIPLGSDYHEIDSLGRRRRNAKKEVAVGGS